MWISIGVLVLVGIWAISAFNRLVRRRNLMKEAWSGVDVQLKRRHDLIPNLVSTVKGYAKHEQDLFTTVTNLRAGETRAKNTSEQGAYETELSGMIKRLFAVVESYPNLRADQNFLQLQKDLAAIEDEIQLSRRYYNGTVRDLNNAVESFPGMFVARLTGYHTAPFFEIEYATERSTPTVEMNQ